jgi:hypothetical protein
MIIVGSDSRMIRDVIAAGRRYDTRGGQRCPIIQQLDSHYGLIGGCPTTGHLRVNIPGKMEKPNFPNFYDFITVPAF